MIQPIDQLLAGGADANGNFTSSQLLPVPTLWGALKVVAQTTGPARWAIFVAGAPKAFGRGERVDLPILVQPGQSVQIQITGTSPNASITGVITGVGGTTLDEVAPYISLVPNTIALDVSGTTSDLGQVSDTNAVGTTKTLTLPTGTIALQILPSASPPTSVTITGTKSRDIYFSVTGITANPYYVIAPQSGFEPQVDVTVTARAAQTNFVEIIALTTPVAQATILTGVGSTGISGGQDTSFGGGNSIPVVPALSYLPTLWQAPTGTVSGFATGATTTLLAGVAAQRIRNWDGIVEVNTASAGTQGTVQDGSGLVLAQFSSATVQNFTCGFIAKPCSLAASLQLVAAAATTIVYSGGTSQG